MNKKNTIRYNSSTKKIHEIIFINSIFFHNIYSSNTNKPKNLVTEYYNRLIKLKRKGFNYYLCSLIIAGGSLPIEDLRWRCGNPKSFQRVLIKRKNEGYINIYKNKYGLEIIKLNRSGYDYFLRFKKRKPEKFEMLFGDILREHNIDIDEENRIFWGVENFEMYDNYRY